VADDVSRWLATSARKHTLSHSSLRSRMEIMSLFAALVAGIVVGMTLLFILVAYIKGEKP